MRKQLLTVFLVILLSFSASAVNLTVENIEIFNVTAEQDMRTGGTLIDEGVNKTFSIGQRNSNFYRYEFNVSNSGPDAWNISTSDLLVHRGLNTSWNVTDIYYRLNQQTKEGGTFSTGNVEWNTSKNGDLKVNESLSAEYIVNITSRSSSVYDQEFEANQSTVSAVDQHLLDYIKYGQLNATIDRPLNRSVVQNNRVFTLNGTVECTDGDCGDITADARSNTSTGQELIDGQDFQIVDSNSTCTLLDQESCIVEWDVNATGDANTFHELDFNVSSQYTDISQEDTTDVVVEIRDILVTSLDYSVVDFGLLDPGQEQNPAENNSAGYNLTVEQDSNTIDNLWIKSTSLVSQTDSNYSIGPGNMTYAEENNYSASTNFSSSYSLLDTNLSPGTVKTLYYWINVPYGILSGEYSGTITFKANQSNQ